MTPIDRELAEFERGSLTPGGHLDAEEIAAALDALDGAEYGAQAARVANVLASCPHGARVVALPSPTGPRTW